MKNLFLILAVVGLVSCDGFGGSTPTSTTGVEKITADIQTRPDGTTVEQNNVRRRLEEDNRPGSTKFIYCISAFSGEVIFQSTAKGKVTSSGKRLSPYNVGQGSFNTGNMNPVYSGQKIRIGNDTHITSEVLQDDGTYGSSIPYVFWWDVNDVYHQHYITGGQIFIVRDQPMTVNRVSIDLNLNEVPQ
jgi:hypothetical protein